LECEVGRVDALTASIAIEDPWTKCLEALHGNVRDRNVEGYDVVLGDRTEHTDHALKLYMSELIDCEWLLASVLSAGDMRRIR
jgi:hypothetical protein